MLRLLITGCLAAFALACSPGPDWEPATADELATLAPIVVVGTASSVDWNNEDFEIISNITITCVLKSSASGQSQIAAGLNVTVGGFGDSAMCLAAPNVGVESIFFMQGNDEDGYEAQFDDLHSAIATLSLENLVLIANALPSSPEATTCGRAIYGAEFDEATGEVDGGEDTCEWHDGRTVAVGFSGMDAQDCNTCVCERGGLIACTEMWCGDDDDDEGAGDDDDDDDDGNGGDDEADTCIWHDGRTVPAGYSGKDADDCNTCTCSSGGNVMCTLMYCESMGNAASVASCAVASCAMVAVVANWAFRAVVG